MGSSKKTQTNKPIYSAQIEGAAGQLSNTYAQNAPKIQGYADSIGGLIPSMIDRYQQGDSGVNAARGWITDTLSNNGANPYLDDMIAQSGNDMAQSINANIGTRGLTGGTAQQQILARELSRNALATRYADFNNAEQRKAQAAGMAPGIAAGDLIAISPLLAAAQTASGLPMQAAAQNAAGIGGLLGQYQTQQQKSSGGLLGALAGIAQLGSSAFGGGAFMLSDRRAKTDVARIGQTDGGLPVYTYRYGGEGPFHMGIMAQEVAAEQPEALGPEIAGYMTVNYAEVR